MSTTGNQGNPEKRLNNLKFEAKYMKIYARAFFHLFFTKSSFFIFLNILLVLIKNFFPFQILRQLLFFRKIIGFPLILSSMHVIVFDYYLNMFKSNSLSFSRMINKISLQQFINRSLCLGSFVKCLCLFSNNSTTDLNSN